MKRFVTVLFLITISLIPIGLVFRILYWPWGNLILTLGFFGLLVFFTAKITKGILENQNDKYKIYLYTIFVLMSIILFAKYFHYPFGDVAGLFVLPTFIILTFLYYKKYAVKNIFIILTTALYLIISIPLLGIYVPKPPRHFIPTEWYDPYDSKENIPIKLPFGFNSDETERLSIKAFDLRQHGHFHDAILIYRQALEIEPQNKKLLFDISDCYAKINESDSAIALLNTVISLDSTYAPFFNNRGLMYYKLEKEALALKSYQKAIELDSTQAVYFANIALAYYRLGLYYKACEAIKKSEHLGMDISDQELLKVIKYEQCSK